MQRKRAWLKWGLLIAVPCALGLAMWPIVQRNRQRAYLHEWAGDIDQYYGVENAPPLPRVRDLLDKGVTPDTPNRWGITLLRRMATFGNLKGVKLLLERGADPNARDKYGNTPLGDALYDAQTDRRVVDMLLAHGAHLKTQNNRGETLLFRCVWQDTKTLKFLLARGLEVNARNNAGETVLHQAIWTPHPPFHTDGDHYAGCDDTKGQALLNLGANPNLQDAKGSTPLMLLAEQREYDHHNSGEPLRFARALLKHGAHLDLRNKHGLTALQIARKSGSKSLARLLERAVSADEE